MRRIFIKLLRSKGFSMVEIIAVFTILAIVSTASVAYFASVGRKSSESVVEITLLEIAKLAVADTRIEGELTIDQISKFASDFQNYQGDTYSVKQGTVNAADEISVYIPQSKLYINLAANSESGKCVFVSFPLTGAPSKQVIEGFSCNAETII